VESYRHSPENPTRNGAYKNKNIQNGYLEIATGKSNLKWLPANHQ